MSEEKKSLQDRLVEKIGKDIGDLVTEEELAGYVGQAIHKAFFEEREIQGSGLYSSSKKCVPWIVKMVNDEMEGAVKEQVRKWFTENVATVEGLIAQRLDAGFSACVMRAIDSVFQNSMATFEQHLKDDIQVMFEDRLLNHG